MKLKKLLIVVDYQNDFVIGSLGFKGAQDIENNIVNKIKKYKKENCQIIFTLDTHFDENYEAKNKNKNGWYLYGRVNDFYSEEVVTFSKYTFAPIELSDYLIKNQYDEIELAGVVTNICILSNAIISQVSLPEAKIIIDATCVASNDISLHNKALDIMEGFKFNIINR